MGNAEYMGRLPRDPQRPLLPQDPLIPTIALLDSTFLGTRPSSSGAAVSTIFAANRHNHQLQLIPTIVPTGSRIGSKAGQFPRRSGAVGFMAKVARIRAGDALHRLTHTIATQASQIGCRAGLSRRRPGVARTGARVAPQRLEDARECEPDGLSRLWRRPAGHLPVPLGSGPAHQGSPVEEQR